MVRVLALGFHLLGLPSCVRLLLPMSFILSSGIASIGFLTLMLGFIFKLLSSRPWPALRIALAWRFMSLNFSISAGFPSSPMGSKFFWSRMAFLSRVASAIATLPRAFPLSGHSPAFHSPRPNPAPSCYSMAGLSFVLVNSALPFL